MRSDSWQIERDFVPETLEDAAELSRAIREAGKGKATAISIVGWLIEKREGRDPLDSATRARYRKVLASLNGSYPGPGRRQRADVTPPLLRSPSSARPTIGGGQDFPAAA